MPTPDSLQPTNLAAQLRYRGRGNPPNSSPVTAISNCFPGLECDFRAAWKRLLTGLELHESQNVVTEVEAGSAAYTAGVRPLDRVLSIADHAVVTDLTGPKEVDGSNVVLGTNNLEWTNALSSILSRAGEYVRCVFQSQTGGQLLTVVLTVRKLFDGIHLLPEAAGPGALTQGLCSPWQADYRECGCYYWAASRPDFVNVEISGAGAVGHNWMQKGRTSTTPKVYEPDSAATPGQLGYEDLYRNWERELRFIIGGKDEA